MKLVAGGGGFGVGLSSDKGAGSFAVGELVEIDGARRSDLSGASVGGEAVSTS